VWVEAIRYKISVVWEHSPGTISRYKHCEIKKNQKYDQQKASKITQFVGIFRPLIWICGDFCLYPC